MYTEVKILCKVVKIEVSNLTKEIIVSDLTVHLTATPPPFLDSTALGAMAPNTKHMEIGTPCLYCNS